MTSTTTLPPLAAIIGEMRRLADERPDFIYEIPAGSNVCLYVEKDDRTGNLVGSCLVGQALVNLGVDPKKLRHPDLDAENLLKKLGSSMTPMLAHWIMLAQSAQDVRERDGSRYTWGEAVALADVGVDVRDGQDVAIAALNAMAGAL